MARQLLDHMVEEADAGGHRILARAVEIYGARDIRLLGRTLDGGGSHGARHRPYFSCCKASHPTSPPRACRHTPSHITDEYRDRLLPYAENGPPTPLAMQYR